MKKTDKDEGFMAQLPHITSEKKIKKIFPSKGTDGV